MKLEEAKKSERGLEPVEINDEPVLGVDGLTLALVKKYGVKEFCTMMIGCISSAYEDHRKSVLALQRSLLEDY